MAGKDRPEPPEAAARRRRLAEALRDNLKRRKSQSRGRRSDDVHPPRSEPRNERD